MMRTFVSVVLVCGAIACHSSESGTPPPPSPVTPKAPVVAPAPPKADAKPLSFEMTKITHDQALTLSPPWHKDHGDWTIIDARTKDGTAFVIGLPPRLGAIGEGMSSGGKSSYDTAMLAVADRATGTKLVAELAHALGVAAPTPGPEKPVHAMNVATTTLTENAMREPSGDFGGVGGGWTSTKWSFDNSEESAQLYVNYNLATKEGEFAEKKPDDDVGVVAAIAASLRDGFDAQK